MGLFLMPLISVGLYILLRVIPRIDPQAHRYIQFARAYSVIRLALLCVLAAIHVATIAIALGFQFDMGLVVSSLTGGLMVLLGNDMSKIRPNWFVGIRTPWTLESKSSWMKTHRQARWIFGIGGLAIIATGFTQSGYALTAALVILLGGTA